MAKKSARLTSLSSAAPNTNSLHGSQAYLKTLQRQHRITIRRLDNIARKLECVPEEEDRPEERQRGSGLVAWFLRMVGGRG